MSGECDTCGEHTLECNCPTILCSADIENFFKKIFDKEMKPNTCFKCEKSYFASYGNHIGECDECWFKRFPKEERESFYRSFF